jgi:hypothetical protein
MKVKKKDEKEREPSISTYHELTVHMIGSHVTLLFDNEKTRDEFFWKAEAHIGIGEPIFYDGKVKTLSCETKEGTTYFNPRNIQAIEMRKE